MELSKFLNILGSCIGFMSALFFAIGALFTSPKDIFNTASMRWDINQYWADSIADQRADYITGALLLVLSFSLLLSANLIPATLQPSLLQQPGCVVAEIVAVLAFLLLCSVLFRVSVSKSTKRQVHKLQEEQEAQEKRESHVRKKS